jgi:hypothetical protein
MKVVKNPPSVVGYKNCRMQDMTHQIIKIGTVRKASMATVQSIEIEDIVNRVYALQNKEVIEGKECTSMQLPIMSKNK